MLGSLLRRPLPVAGLMRGLSTCSAAGCIPLAPVWSAVRPRKVWFRSSSSLGYPTTVSLGTDCDDWPYQHRHGHQQSPKVPPGTRLLSTSLGLHARAKTARGATKQANSDDQAEVAPPDAYSPGSDAAPAPSQQHQQLSIEERLERSQIKTLEDKATQKYVAKVFATTTSTIGAAAATSGAAVFTGVAASIPMWFSAVGIVPLMGFYMLTNEHTSPAVRGGLLAAFTGIQGLGLAPIIGMVAATDVTILPLALGGTALIMAGSSGAALLAPRASMLKFAPILGGSAMALFGLGLFGMGQYALTGTVSPWLSSINLYGGLGLAVAFTAFDTQNIIEEYRSGSRDFVRHSVDMFVNFLMIFKRLLFLLLDRD